MKTDGTASMSRRYLPMANSSLVGMNLDVKELTRIAVVCY